MFCAGGLRKVIVIFLIRAIRNVKSVYIIAFLAATACVLAAIVKTGHAATDGKATVQPGPAAGLGAVSGRTAATAEIIARSQSPTDSKPLAEPTLPHRWRTVQMRVTAYCSCPKCCGEYSDGMTASGHRIQPGDSFVAADKEYPFGTVMVIPGYNGGGAVKVLDRGGAITGPRLDVFFDSHQRALEWGVRNILVQVHN